MKIQLYLSKQGYDSKPDKSAGIIKSINSYELVQIEPEELYTKLINGHFMHHECGCSPSTTGSSCYTFKKRLLKQAQVMCVDFDYKFKDTKNTGEVVEKHYEPNEMPDWDDKLLSNLTYTNSIGKEIDISPTFWMESFSAHKVTEKKIVGNSVHLFYVFEDPIRSVYDYEKTAVSIIYALYNALKNNGYDIPLESVKCPFDPVSTDMFQGLWGSYGKKHGYSGKTYFWDEFCGAYKKEYKDFIFKVKQEVNEEASLDDIKRTIEAYSSVQSIDDIDISKSQYLKYKKYFGHEEGFHIMSVLKHEYSLIEEQVNSKQSLCYQVCRKLLLGHCNDFFDMDETHFYNEYKRCKIYIKKGSDEAAYMSHVIRLIGDTGAIPMIEYKQDKDPEGNIIKLSDTEYLSDKKDIIQNMFKDDSINFIIAAPGLGKTVFAQSLPGNTLIIELFNSIIQSEEKFPSNEFTKFYGSKYIKIENITKMNVCSANKFVTWYKNDYKHNSELYGLAAKTMFDNIILDESHLLCLSNYRYDIMGETVKYLKKLKSEFPGTNVIIMTGTPFGEDKIFDNLNTIKIEAKPRHKKTFHMIQTTSTEGYMRELIKISLSKGYRIFMPVDSENWFDTFIESCEEYGIISKDKCYYFNQPKNTEEIEVNILNTKTIGDITILGTSSYMSVGIDLEDWRTEFITIIPSGASATGNFSGIEVEQFANRHRKQNLDVYYVISNNENNTKKPVIASSCRALLSIKNDILKSMYRTNPIVIKMPMYLVTEDTLEVNEDMFNVYTYYKDMKPIISHPAMIYEYMQKKSWSCEWITVDHTERGIDTKEHKEKEKKIGTSEFMKLLDEWNTYNYPTIIVKDSVVKELEIVKHESKYELFGLDSIEVGFTTYYAKNVLFGELLHLREYLTGNGAYTLIMDAFDGSKINIAFIERRLLGIKLRNNYERIGVWQEIHDKLRDFYSNYSTIDDGVHKNNKKVFEFKLDCIIQKIWDSLCERVNDETLKLALNTNYGNVTENLIDGFMDGVKLVCTMHLESKTMQKRIDGKNTKVTVFSWKENALAKYEIRDDKVKTN